MRQPDFDVDGWCLEDGEQRNREHPDKFLIPDLAVRDALQPGDFAKLVFRIAIEDQPEAFERMWVIVRARVSGGYLGMLDNEPTKICENDEFWRGTELPFQAKHIVAVEHANAESRTLAGHPPRRQWV